MTLFYLATVIDCYTKMVLGYAIADHYRASLVCDAIAMAARRYSLTAEAIFHSDYAEVLVKPRNSDRVCAA